MRSAALIEAVFSVCECHATRRILRPGWAAEGRFRQYLHTRVVSSSVAGFRCVYSLKQKAYRVGGDVRSLEAREGNHASDFGGELRGHRTKEPDDARKSAR
jgi:hypothetical protein